MVARARVLGRALLARERREDLERVHDAVRVQRALDLAHELHSDGAALLLQEAHLAQPHAVLARGRAAEGQRAAHHAVVQSRHELGPRVLKHTQAQQNKK